MAGLLSSFLNTPTKGELRRLQEREIQRRAKFDADMLALRKREVAALEKLTNGDLDNPE